MKHQDWTGRILIEASGGVFLGEGGDTPVHAHHSYKFVVALEGRVTVTSTRRGPLRGRMMLVHPNEPHVVRARDSRLALVYVEPQSAIGRCLEATERGEGRALVPGTVDWLVERLTTTPPETLPGLDMLLRQRVQGTRPHHLDSRVRRVVQRLDIDCPIEERISDLAQDFGLSASRLSHLFAEGLGISLVRYRRWRHLRRAMGELAAGVGVTAAAHANAFSDAAHLCRTFVQMMGITPGVFGRMELVAAQGQADQPIRSMR